MKEIMDTWHEVVRRKYLEVISEEAMRTNSAELSRLGKLLAMPGPTLQRDGEAAGALRETLESLPTALARMERATPAFVTSLTLWLRWSQNRGA